MAEVRFAAIILFAFLAIDAVILANFVASLGTLYPDFFGTWSFARFAAMRPLVEMYDQFALQAFQRELGPGVTEFYPFTYPPIFRLILLPLGGLGFAAAYAVWVVPALAAYVWVGARLAGGLWAVPALLAMPATALGLVYGQSGFLTAALLLGGMLQLLRGRQVAAGVLFGLLTFKPQLGLLLPVALLAARQWRAIGAAVGMAAAMAVLSLLVDGWAPWPAWLGNMEMHAMAMEMAREKFARIMATPTAVMMALNAGKTATMAVQAVATLGAALVVWGVFRRGITTLGIAVLAVGTFVATPYAFAYDTPLAMAGALLFLAVRRRETASVPGLELALVVFTALAPATVFADTLAVPMLPLLLMALFGAISVRAFQKDSAVA